MQGRPRKALHQKAKKLQLSSISIPAIPYTAEALEISSKLLEANPEYYTAWSYRKLAVENNLSQSEAETDSDSIQSIAGEELRVMGARQRAFFNRSGIAASESAPDAGHSEFSCLELPRFIAALKNVSDEEELKFTTDTEK